MIKYTFQKYDLFFEESVEHEIYDMEWVDGIKFTLTDGTYDLCHNKVDWNRIIIVYNSGAIKDLPFNENTLKFLPSYIKVIKCV